MLQPAGQLFETYLRELHKVYGLREDGTEHSGRTALHTLLRAFAAEVHRALTVTHEPKKVAGKGAPDFKVTKAGLIIGYVENKAPGTPLKPVIESEQVAKYKQLSDNVLITDYLHFVRISGGKVVARATLVHAEELNNPKVAARTDKAAEVAGLLRAFLSVAPEGIARAAVLAEALAVRSRLLRDALTQELIRQQKEHEEGRLFGLYRAFQKQVFAQLKLKEFADAFAQTLAYGLFLAKLSADATQVDLQNAHKHVPASFGLIRELVDFLEELEKDEYADIRWLVNEILSIINGLKLAEIHEDLSFRHRKIRRGIRARSEEEARLFERDPFVFFYEDYLARYDAKTRKSRGVYYTPPPVVNFIVRAVDDMLVSAFAIKDGLADHHNVTVLDFACGTGTFLVEVFERVRDRTGDSTAKLKLLVRNHLLRHIFGFEYLIAPYTIGHLKLSQYLKDRYGYTLGDKERLGIYLTNTLEPVDPQDNFLLPQLTAEAKEAQRIKQEQPILVITGNPPYAGHSQNKGVWIRGLVEEYKRGVPELRKPGQAKWLQDDYVKFIRFAQWKMEQVPAGIVGIICNHSFLDNPTFRGMRQSLMRAFDQIWTLDLHGNAKRKETAPDGSKDENIFDIEQGVAVTLFVKNPGVERGVWRADFWGLRLAKYKMAADSAFENLEWNRVHPSEPFFLFKSWDADLAAVYGDFWSVRDIFSPMGDPAPGIVTTHDQFAISFSKPAAFQKVDTLLETKSEEEARRLFRLCSQSQWSYETAKRELGKGGWKAKAIQVLYRPFDVRWTIFDSNVAVHRRTRMTDHMLAHNIALLTSRLTKGEEFRHVQVTERIPEVISMSPKTSNNGFVFPLYLFRSSCKTKSQRDLFEDADPPPARSGTRIWLLRSGGGSMSGIGITTHRRRFSDTCTGC